jgi:hypothetical protein
MAEMDDEEMPPVIVVVRREVEDERDEGGDVSDGVTNGGRASRVVEEVWLGAIWEGFGVGFGGGRWSRGPRCVWSPLAVISLPPRAIGEERGITQEYLIPC